MAFRAGSLNEPDDLTGLAWFLARVIDRGTATAIGGRDCRGARRSRRGAAGSTTNRHVITLSCTCLSEDFNDVLAVVADVARNPVFPEEEIEKRRAETITAIRQDLDNPGIRASEALQALLYGRVAPVRPSREGHASRASSASAGQISLAYHAGAVCAGGAVRRHRRRRARRGRGRAGARRRSTAGTPWPSRSASVPPRRRRRAGAAADRDRDAGQAAVATSPMGSPASAGSIPPTAITG